MSSRITVFCFALLVVLLSADASARNTLHRLPAADVLNESGFASQIAGVKFYFGNSPHPAVIQEFGEYRTNKKTNAFNKTDVEACKWVFKSAILALHQRAVSLGANAVVNIRSNYKNNVEVSDTDYTCGAGGLMAGVALIGDFVKVE
jgi:uncharacterized protein YbjQ (UPF0145 family)